MHVRAALRNGLEPAEIAEVFLQTAVYAGVPAANRAFAIADQTLREAGVVSQQLAGTSKLNSLRREDLDARFPGLLDAILAPEPATA